MDDFKRIMVIPGKPVNVQNPTVYPLIGKGLQGAVFKLNDHQCVKIYSRKKYCTQEQAVLQNIGMKSNLVPEIFDVGENFIIMEYLTGPSLQEYLEETGIVTQELAKQLLELLNELKRCEFPRIDFSLRHTIFDKHGRLKIIDHVNSFTKKRQNPKRLLTDLNQVGVLTSFLEQIKIIKPNLYYKWMKLIKKWNL